MTEVSGNPKPKVKAKIKGTPLVRTPAQIAAVERAAVARKEADDLAVQESEADAVAARTAQIANLLIAGHTFETIGRQIGMSAVELEREFTKDSARYVRTQASLRIWVRNWISAKYSTMIEANWDHAKDKTSAERLENQDRVIKMLNGMERLHGAAAPTQSEIKVDAAPEMVQKVVDAIASKAGVGYDMDIFDIDPDDITETVHEAPGASLAALEQASRVVEAPVEVLPEPESL